ncbi:MAG: EAL domain-containing protein [Bradyrhizobium sp.]|nr:EAL domain-containing protein [Bradyrhizobium sp.]
MADTEYFIQKMPSPSQIADYNPLASPAGQLVKSGEEAKVSASKMLQLGAIARATPWSIVSHLINTSIALIAFRTSVSATGLLVWALSSYAVGCWILYRWFARRRSKSRTTGLKDLRKPQSVRKNVITGAVLAAPWGALAFWLLGQLPQHQELVLITVLAGMSSGGATLLSAAAPAAFTFVVLILGPVSIKCLLLNTGEYWLVGALSISYALFLATTIKTNAKLFADNGRMLDQLENSLAVTEHARREVEHIAMHDLLTGLANRRAFLEKIENGRDLDRLCALLYIDLDRFKPVNDKFGHGIGDKLLQGVAARLRDVVGDGGLAARIGGDEFAVLMMDVEDQAEIRNQADNILKRLSEPYSIDGRSISIGAAIGIALAGHHEFVETTRFMKMADLALYKAKHEAECRCSFFTQAMLEELTQRQATEDALHLALAENQFELYFQPIVDLASLDVVGAEALIRWNHPQRGLILPGEFLQLAEEINLLQAIEVWVLEEACRQATTWPEGLTVAVNLSPTHIEHSEVVETVACVLAKEGLRPQRLEIEITESALLNDNIEVRHKLERLKELGVKLAVDDFGTGYSSLAYLSRFPFDRIKVDRSFVQEMLSGRGGASIIRATAEMALDLGLKTTAEGIETPTQLFELRKLRIEHGQGFLFTRPLSAANLAAFLASNFSRKSIVTDTDISSVPASKNRLFA